MIRENKKKIVKTIKQEKKKKFLGSLECGWPLGPINGGKTSLIIFKKS